MSTKNCGRGVIMDINNGILILVSGSERERERVYKMCESEKKQVSKIWDMLVEQKIKFTVTPVDHHPNNI